MLKAMLNKEKYDALSEELKGHYTEKDGKFILSVTKTDGLGLENVDGLKLTLEKLRTSERALQADVKTAEDALKKATAEHTEFTTKFTGIDPEAAKSALDKIAEIKDWDGETKVREAVLVAEQRIQQKMQAKMDELVTKNTTLVTGLQKDLGDSQDQLQEAIVTSKIVEAISNEDGNVNVLMPHVKKHVKMTKDVHGKWKPEVTNATGDPRIGGSDGADMTILQLVQEMKSQDTFAGCFPGANSTGTGQQNSTETGSHRQNTTERKVIPSSDDKAMSKNIDDIASGKTKVDMSQ